MLKLPHPGFPFQGRLYDVVMFLPSVLFPWLFE